MDQVVYAGIPLAIGFAGWITVMVFNRPTRLEVNRIEDRIVSEMNKMEKRLMEAIRNS